MRILVGAILDLPLQAHRTGGWESLELDDIWGGGAVLFVDKVRTNLDSLACSPSSHVLNFVWS